MNESILKIRMFGELTLTLDDHTISEEQNRTRKMWNLMAYILYNRGRTVSQEELLELMWNNSFSFCGRVGLVAASHKKQHWLASG